MARQIVRDIDQTGDQHEQQRRAAVAQPAEDGREQVIRDDEEGPAAADAYITRRERDAHGKLRHHERDKVEHLTARGDGGESRGRAEPPDDEQVDGAVDCL